MRTPRIKRSFERYSDANFNQFSESIIKSLTDNDHFPEVADELANFKAAYDEYFESIPARSIRNSINTATKNANKEIAIDALLRLSFYVEYKANFALDALESSGFELVAKPQRKKQVGLVQHVTLKTNGVEGMVIAQCKRDENAATYKVRVSTDQKNWNWFNAGTSRTIKVHGVPTDVQIYVQMQVGNSRGNSPWSESVTGVISTYNVISSIHEE